MLETAAEAKKELIDQQGFLSCQMCGTSRTFFWEVHHIVFRSEAPKHPNLNHKDNLLICCSKCHAKLHKKKAARQSVVQARKLYDLFPDILTLRP